MSESYESLLLYLFESLLVAFLSHFQAEEESAKDENSVILGVQVSPICGIGRLRMVRARSLGEALADHLRAAGAGEILAEIRETGTSKSDPVKPKQIQQSISTVDSNEKVSSL